MKPSIPGATMIHSKPYAYLSMNGLQSQAVMPWYDTSQSDSVQRDLPPVTLKDAVKEPRYVQFAISLWDVCCRIHLNILRSAGFDDLYNVLAEFVRVEGPVENVCISFLFRKVDSKKDVCSYVSVTCSDFEWLGREGHGLPERGACRQNGCWNLRRIQRDHLFQNLYSFVPDR